MPKSSLPTLPRVEYHGELALQLGGVHGYKKVKRRADGGFQGASPNSKIYTGIKKDAKQAAIALAEKKFIATKKREPRMPQDETALPLALPNYDQGNPPPNHPIPLPTDFYCSTHSSAAASSRQHADGARPARLASQVAEATDAARHRL